MSDVLNELKKAIASGAINPRQVEKAVAEAEQERREYVRHMPERILKAFTHAVDEKGEEIGDVKSAIKFRRDPETGEVVIHTSNRHAHALLYAQALRREHDAGLLKFDVKSQKDPKTKDGWHYRITINGDDAKSLERVYRSLQIIEKNNARFQEYGKPEPKAPKPTITKKPAEEVAAPPTPKPIVKPTPSTPPAVKKPEPKRGWLPGITAAAGALLGLASLFSSCRRQEELKPVAKAPIVRGEKGEMIGAVPRNNMRKLVDAMLGFEGKNPEEYKIQLDTLWKEAGRQRRKAPVDYVVDELLKNKTMTIDHRQHLSTLCGASAELQHLVQMYEGGKKFMNAVGGGSGR